MRSMGLECSSSPQKPGLVDTDTVGEVDKEEIVPEFGRLWSHSVSDVNDRSMSSWSSEETASFEGGTSDDNSVSGSSRDGGGSSNVSRSSSSLSFIQRLMSRSGKISNVPKAIQRRRIRWFRRLGLGTAAGDHGGDDASTSSSQSDQQRNLVGRCDERVKVRSYRKRSTELSAVYQGQVIKAHNGAILTMKFSPDGKFLATGGEDRVVRVWGVAQSEDCKVPMDDPSCVVSTSKLIPTVAWWFLSMLMWRRNARRRASSGPRSLLVLSFQPRCSRSRRNHCMSFMATPVMYWISHGLTVSTYCQHLRTKLFACGKWGLRTASLFSHIATSVPPNERIDDVSEILKTIGFCPGGVRYDEKGH